MDPRHLKRMIRGLCAKPTTTERRDRWASGGIVSAPGLFRPLMREQSESVVGRTLHAARAGEPIEIIMNVSSVAPTPGTPWSELDRRIVQIVNRRLEARGS